MGAFLSILTKVDEILAKGEQWFLTLLVVLMCGTVFLQVLYRYLLAQPLQWSEELARYLFVWIALVGAALSVRDKGHFGVDYIFRKLPERSRRGFRLLVHLAMIGLVLVLLTNGILLVQKTADQLSPAMQISMAWPYACVPVGSALMLLHLVSIILREEAKTNSLHG